MKRLLLLIIFIAQFTNAQDVTIRTNVGFAGYGNPFDGYYFSFDVGIPIVKGVSVAPTFTFATNYDYKRIDYSKSFPGLTSPSEETINSTNNRGGKMSGLFEVYCLINPLQFLKNRKFSRHEFAIGAGYGMSVYNHNYYQFDVIDNTNTISVLNKSGIRSSFSVKAFYNYYFRHYFVGINIGAIDFINGEGVSLLGIQFGIKL